MTPEMVIERLDSLTDADPEAAHGTADAILIEFLRGIGYGTVANAFENASDRVGFWYG